MYHQFKTLLKPYFSFIKGWILRFLRSLPISSEKIGPPKGFYEATRDWVLVYKSNKSKITASYIEIHPSHKISRLEPRVLKENVHWQFRGGYISYQYESPPTFVAVVPDGRVYGSQGAVITQDDKLLADVSIELGAFRRNTKSHSSLVLPKNAKDHSVFRQLRLPPIYSINGRVAVLSSLAGSVYYYWMFDVLPRIELLRLGDIDIDSIDKFIVNNIHYPFQKETLTTLGISPEKVIESNNFFHIKADSLIVPSLPGHTFNQPKWACDFLRREFFSETIKELDKSNKPERIYVTRATANSRRVINEAELINFLNRFGFESVILESISVAEQALLFSSAKIIIAPHGSGLTNLAFCSPGAKVIEFFSPNFVNCCFWTLSNLVDVEYYYIIGEGQRPPEYVDPLLMTENILINLDRLADVMDFVGVR